MHACTTIHLQGLTRVEEIMNYHNYFLLASFEKHKVHVFKNNNYFVQVKT